MPELILNPVGFTPDPIDGLMTDAAGVVHVRGDVVQLLRISTGPGPGLNTVIVNAIANEDASPVHAVVLETSSGVAGSLVRVRIYGIVDCQLDDDTTAITQAAPALISSISSSESALVDSLSPASTADVVAGGNGSIRILAIYLGGGSGTAAANGVSIDQVMFDGFGGLGMANAALS